MSTTPTPAAKPFVLGICLDGPLRDITEPFFRAYAERFGPEPEDQTHVVTTRWQTEEEADQAIAAGEQTEDGKQRLVIHQEEIDENTQPMKPLRLLPADQVRDLPELGELNPFNLLEKLEFKDQAETDEFVQGDGFFIFARAPQSEAGLLTWMTQLYYGVRSAGGRVVLIGNDMPKLRPAALFFAANLGGVFDEVRFVDAAEAYWEGVDILVTASQRLLDARPAGKKVAYRLTAYNNEAAHELAAPNPDNLPLSADVTYLRGIEHLTEYFPITPDETESSLSPEQLAEAVKFFTKDSQ